MRRTLIVVCLVLSCWWVGLPAVASAGPPINRRKTPVPFTGTSTFEFGTDCSFVHQVFDAGLGVDGGLGTLRIEGCTSVDSLFIQFKGTFVLTTPHQGSMEGTVTGASSGQPALGCPEGYSGTPFAMTLTPSGGTRALRSQKDPMEADVTWCSSTAPGVPGPIFGTLTTATVGTDALLP